MVKCSNGQKQVVKNQVVKRPSSLPTSAAKAAGRCEASIRIELSDLVVKRVVKW